MAQTKLRVGRREKKKRNRLGRREKLAQKSREEGEIGSESREKGDLPPCSPPSPGRCELDKLTSFPMCGFIAQLEGKWRSRC